MRLIKEYGDGALGSRGAWLLEPYSDKPDSVGLQRPDGRSLVTSVGTRQRAIWIHDAAGERPTSSEGYAMLSRLSRDGTRVFYLLVRAIAPTHTPSVTNWRLGVLPTVDLDELWT